MRPAAILLLFCSGSAAFFDQLLAPRTGPIDSSKRNFALPTHPRLVTVLDAPPVFEIPQFMSEEECARVIEAAQSGEEMPAVPYGRRNDIFTGRKWAAAGSDAAAPFFERCCETFGGVKPTRFEPVTVTRYETGEFQAKHLDSRLPHEIKRTPAYLAAGGQRIAQLIVYLQVPASGGETRFFNPCFEGLSVTPEVGKALVFPTATLEGLADERYLHSGEPVTAGTKWIMGTWLMERERTDGAEVTKAVDELWRLSGREPPPRRSSAPPKKSAQQPPRPAGGGLGAASSKGKASAKGKKKRTKKK